MELYSLHSHLAFFFLYKSKYAEAHTSVIIKNRKEQQEKTYTSIYEKVH